MTSTAEETIARLKEQAEAAANGETEEEVAEEEIIEEEAAAKKHGDSNREYIVLQNWTEAARVMASSSEGAIRQLPEGELKDGAKYVVIPARNWNEHEVAIETKTTISVK